MTPEFVRGDRVRLVRTNDPHTRLTPGDEGTVTSVRDVMWLSIGVKWDSGSSLTMLPDDGDVIVKVGA